MPRNPIGGNLLSKGSVDTTLGGDGVGSGREKLGNTGSVETSLGQTEGSTQTGTTGTDNDGIVLVVLQQSELHRLYSIHAAVSAYNHGVLVVDVAIGLLGAQRSVGPDLG